MKRNAFRRKLAAFLNDGPEAESAAQRHHAAQPWDDGVSEDFFDVEDDDADVAFIVQDLKRQLH